MVVGIVSLLVIQQINYFLPYQCCTFCLLSLGQEWQSFEWLGWFGMWGFHSGRSWLKWFLTMSWLTIAGFITDPGKRESFVLIIEMKPSTMDCKSNHVLSEINSSGNDAFCFQFLKNWSAPWNFTIRLSFTWLITCCQKITLPSYWRE